MPITLNGHLIYFAAITESNQLCIEEKYEPYTYFDGSPMSNGVFQFDMWGLKEDIKSIGQGLYESWLSKERISPLISNTKTKEIIDDVMNMGAYGAKLLGSGGCGFVLVVSDTIVKQKIVNKYNGYVLDIKFNTNRILEVFPN